MRYLLPTVVLLAILLLVGCGGSGSPSTPPPSGTTVAPTVPATKSDPLATPPTITAPTRSEFKADLVEMLKWEALEAALKEFVKDELAAGKSQVAAAKKDLDANLVFELAVPIEAAEMYGVGFNKKLIAEYAKIIKAADASRYIRALAAHQSVENKLASRMSQADALELIRRVWKRRNTEPIPANTSNIRKETEWAFDACVRLGAADPGVRLELDGSLSAFAKSDKVNIGMFAPEAATDHRAIIADRKK